MRVPNMTMYELSTYQLGNLTEKLKNANEVVSSQKRINSMTDDPVGLTQVLDLNLSIKNLEQTEKNVQVGKTWLTSAENALASANDLILEAKTEVSRLINASATADERKDAVDRINNIIEQMVSLGNTQLYGEYIFSGTKTDTTPFVYNDSPPGVTYQGNEDPFRVQIDKSQTLEVGRDGSAVFFDDIVTINSTNNTIVFREDNGHGSASEKVMTAVIPEGEYTAASLEKVIRNAINDASETDGYGATYLIAYDEEKKAYSIREDGSYDGYLRTSFLWDSGWEARVTDIETSSGIDPDDVTLAVENKEALTIGTPEPHGTDPFKLVWDGTQNWIVENNPGYVIIPSTIPGTAEGVDIDLDEDGLADISISLSRPVENEGEYIQFEIVPESQDTSLGYEIGFLDNTVLIPPVSDTNPVFLTDITLADGATFDFQEVNSTGGTATLTINLNTSGADVSYTDMNVLAQLIESNMEAESLASGNSINYAVTYDDKTSRFNIREDGSELNELHVLWNSTSGGATTAANLGFYPLEDVVTYPKSDVATQADITIDGSNNMLDFEEIVGLASSGPLRAFVPSGTYRSISDLETAVATAMNNASATPGVTYAVSYDDTTHRFTISDTSATLTELGLLWSSGQDTDESIGKTLGYDISLDDTGAISYGGDNDVVLMTFDSSNNKIDFEEVDVNGLSSGQISIAIPEGDYIDLDDVAAEIESALDENSPNEVDYTVVYDYTAGEFMIKGSDAAITSFSLLWESGENASQSAADMLGFDPGKDVLVTFAESDKPIINITIGPTNNKLDFKEIIQGSEGLLTSELTAEVAQGTYTSYESLAAEIEEALEAESLQNGNRIDYHVSYDEETRRFTIKESGSELSEFQLLWGTGTNRPTAEGGTGESIAAIIGFDTVDDAAVPSASERPVEWGVFNTLIDLNSYLEKDDVSGIQRTLGRLESHFDKMTSVIANIGIKYNRLDIRERIMAELTISLKERSSLIEDADMVQSIMDLQAIQTAYQAALSSTSRVINISLVDYLS